MKEDYVAVVFDAVGDSVEEVTRRKVDEGDVEAWVEEMENGHMVCEQCVFLSLECARSLAAKLAEVLR